ncbi:MAG: hypothetical protein A2297_09040 [Elusimicrobia bacterium RIFOXYB2_FULL_48_7]|nr:MAG: hypothetical protein A2297_09040 [Elusimicrobia bacterium RIFOXYB2_FULL_48_7]
MNPVVASTVAVASYALGLGSSGVVWAYALTILSALLCVGYGIMNWNKPAKDQSKEVEEEVKWEQKENEVMK